MDTKEVHFESAEWISAGGEYPAPMFRKSFTVYDIKEAKILIGCFGMFEGYINGKPITYDKFGTLNTDFHERYHITSDGMPFDEKTGHRLYCPEYDVTSLISDGKNTLCFMTGSGWYESNNDYRYGHVKLCFLLTIVHSDGRKSIIVSDRYVKTHKSFLSECDIITGETQNFENFPDNWKNTDFDDSSWENAIVEKAPDTCYYPQSCPGDRVIRRIVPTLIAKTNGKRIYDVGEIITGYPIIYSPQGIKQKITIRYSELLDSDGKLDELKVYNQHTVFYTDDTQRTLHAMFTWLCFRYFEVDGECEVGNCLVIHSDVAVNSSFSCDSDVLNWIYNAYISTQLANMHGGVPSDCPHTERRGYTGDGQLVCNAAMTYLDAQSFYKKWIYDIADCQDKITGHVQYTAPFVPNSGGGPGGWGCAIVNVPYEYYRHYRDSSVLVDLYPNMLRYFEYLENHSKNDLVVSDRKGSWCLGEWVTPEQETLNLFSGIKLPAPFVNTYFYIKSIKQVLEIAELLDITKDNEKLKNLLERKKAAMIHNYFDKNTGNFCDNVQGANAFAIDIGLGDERTLENMISNYRKIAHFDTGIFGTDIVVRVLFEKGYADVAIMLLTSNDPISFYHEMSLGATTLLEYWSGERSQCHPMFGAASVYLAEYILGIRRAKGLKNDEIIINPVSMNVIKKASGFVTSCFGKISVSYDATSVIVTIPDNMKANIDISDRKVIVNQTH